MRTGSSRPHRRPAQIFIAVFSALSLAAVVGCADNSPVAAPTSTLPAEQPDTASTDDSAEVAIPEYETDLDLDNEEKKAVDGALVAFVGYIDTINRVFSSGGKDLNDIETYAAADSLDSLRQSANDLEKDSKYMAGEYDYYNVRVQSIAISADSSDKDSVKILFCSHDSKHAVVGKGKTMPSQPKTSLTILQTASKHNGDWKISNQELWSKKCE
ncbi:hypothetical protein SAMN04489752_2644 [Brevibacterium siliguriense]|uniref:Lipoprotein n=1 Tax=Brevibacterium siliguriense TaxID=1136497 RepID=A0A1H1VG46_9MICO|nr:hypothetical protein [Brevibacterium siliguriense]SDS83655.1 hypothetical protein SAMN04489752_2644 [Brevibacterium siliguriense]